MRRVAAIAVALLSLDLTARPGWGREPAAIWTGAARHAKGTTGLADLAERARAAVVHVRGEMGDGSTAGESDSEAGRTSIGTGFVINKDGYILTNEHVVRGVVDLRVRLFDGRELPACVVGADLATDLALLKVTTKRPLPVLALGDSSAVRVGEPVIAIGNPYGFNHSVTAGIVSAKERVVDRASLHEPGAEDLYSFFIQTDASINLGNSGGPLIDASGAVIGVNAAFWAGHPMQPAQGIGFAIPINMAKALLPRLLETGTARRAYLGVDAQPIDPALEAALKLPSGRGALIASIEKGSPAEAAGLEPGDVVVDWNGADVASSEDFKIDAQLSTPGVRIKIALLRDGKRAEHEIIPRAAPVKEVAPPHPSSCARTPEPLMANVDDFDVQETPVRAGKPAGGVTVTRVTDHSAAAQAGLRIGDIVLRIGKAGVLKPPDVAQALGGFKLGEPVPMLVRRSGFDFWMAFTRR
ncbi:MAG TPA: trypsin-like peptidase domain-containing protein [Polyangia bacterium]|nr:trypsin-like peptidase domain-containing protein [Polyangia bacterium]